MKKITTLILAIFISGVLRAEYGPLKLYEMIIKSDVIVWGKIVKIDSTQFIFQIENSLTGEHGDITVEKFKNWPCASRWKDYETGQRLFLFLKNYNGKLRAMSGGDEGELPIFHDSVFIHGLTLSIPPPPPPRGAYGKSLKKYNYHLKNDEYFEYGSHIVYGCEYRGLPVEKDKFIITVREIRNCFDFEYGKYRKIQNGKVMCSRKKVNSELKDNKFFRWTYKELIK